MPPSASRDANGGFRPSRPRGTRATTEALEPRRLLAATLLGDLNANTMSASPAPFVATADGTVYFGANDGTRGHELHRSDGTAAGTRLVKDVFSGPSSGLSPFVADFPGSMAALGNTVLFVAQDGTSGAELWRSDGTGAGTIRVKDLYPGPGGSAIRSMTTAGGVIYFFAYDGSPNGSQQLWRSDGTEAGTFTLTSGNYFSSVSPTAVGDKLVFRWLGDNAGEEVWATDGTVAGTVRITDIHPSAGSQPDYFAAAGAIAYFTAVDGSGARGLYKTDGTAGGTTLVKSFAPGSPPSQLVASASKLYFVSGNTLWISNGTGPGTAVVRAFSSVSGIRPAGDAAGSVYFIADGTDGAGLEAWRSDGTEGGTFRVADLAPGTLSSQPTGFVPVGDGSGAVYFAASPEGPAKNRALYRTNAAGTSVTRLTAATASVNVFTGSPTQGNDRSPQVAAIVVNGRAFFSATTPTYGAELWLTDGTVAGTALVKDVNADTAVSNPSRGILLNGRLLFAAHGTTSGVELHVSDGTPGGTALVKDIWPGAEERSPTGLTTGSSSPTGFLRAGNYVYFSANEPASGRELWRTDGSEAGTVRVKDINPGTAGSAPAWLTAIGDVVYFAATDADGGSELWRTDGTDAGTIRVRDLNPGTASAAPTGLAAIGSTLYFAATDGTSGTELWKTDGTAGGTTRVKDIYPGATGSNVANLFSIGDTVYFTAYTTAGVTSLFRTDGTDTGTTAIRTVYVGNWSGALNTMVAFNGALLFSADLGDGYELHRVNDAGTGTVTLKDIYPGFGSSSPTDLTVSGSLLYFTADDGTTGRELWVTDGTPDGTRQVADLNPGAATSYADGLLAVPGGRVAFGTSEGINGTILWLSDGTAGGTTQLGTVRAPVLPYDSPRVTGVGVLPSADGATGTAMFGADDGTRGTEPWAVDVPPTPAPVARAGGPYTTGEGLALTLSAAASTGPIDQYEWDLNYDGVTFGVDVAGRDVVFPPTDGPATRAVAVRVIGPGGTSIATSTVTVSNLAPVVDLGADRAATEGAPVFVPAAITDPSWNTAAGEAGGDAVTFSWSVTNAAGAVVASGAGPQAGAAFTPPDDGVYTVTFTATDDDGAAGSDTALVTAANVAPIVSVSGLASTDEGSTYTLNLETSDPGADTISVVRVDWGDGQTQTIPGNPPSVTHVYDDGPALRPVTVTVTDEDGEYAARQNGAAAGTLDTSYGTGGRTLTALTGLTADIAEDVLIQPDGKAILVGWANNGNNPKFALTRYTTGGALDTTFGTAGKVLTSFPETGTAFAKGAALQPDGKIVAVGFSHFEYALIARYNADGSPDTTFAGDGLLATRFGAGNNAAWAVAVDAQGRIVVAGHHEFNNFAVMRLLPDGTPDASFGGGDGIVITNVSGGAPGGVTGDGTDQAHDLVLLPDGRIALGGYANTDLAVAVYLPDGRPDPSFSGDGIAFADFGGSVRYEYGDAIALDPQGRLVVGGTGYPSPGDGQWVMARFNADGSRDTSFGSAGQPGVVREDLTNSNDIVQSILHDPVGRLIAIGASDSDATPRVVRYRPDGSRDTTFGTNGIATFAGGGIRGLEAGAFATDGNLIVGGRGAGPADTDFVVAKLQVASEHEVTVRNVAPTVGWGDRSAFVGRPVVLAPGATDPSAADRAAGLRYSFDLNDDGDFTDPGDVLDSTSAAYTFAATGTFPVGGRVADKDGGRSDARFTVTVSTAPPVLLSAASVKEHLLSGDAPGTGTLFPVPLPLGGAYGIEPRQNGPTQLVLTFDEPVRAGAEFNVTLSSGTLSGPATVTGDTLTVNLTGAADGQVLVVAVNGLTDADGNAGVYRLEVGVLWGDVNGNREVNVNDVNVAKIASGQVVSAANFRADLNMNAELNVNDVNIAKIRAGGTLPLGNPGADDVGQAGTPTVTPTPTRAPGPTGTSVTRRPPAPIRPTPTGRTAPAPPAPAARKQAPTPTATSVITSGGRTKAAGRTTDLLVDEEGLAQQ